MTDNVLHYLENLPNKWVKNIKRSYVLLEIPAGEAGKKLKSLENHFKKIEVGKTQLKLKAGTYILRKYTYVKCWFQDQDLQAIKDMADDLEQ
jgi:hypothetical protein